MTSGARADRSELIARLEAERIPDGVAFTWRPDAPELDDSLSAVAGRRRDLLAALGVLSPAGGDHRSAGLRVVA